MLNRSPHNPSEPLTTLESKVEELSLKIDKQQTLLERILDTKDTNRTEKLLTVKEASLMLKVSRPMLLKLRREGKLDEVYIGRTVRVPLSSIERFISNGEQSEVSRLVN